MRTNFERLLSLVLFVVVSVFPVNAYANSNQKMLDAVSTTIEQICKPVVAEGQSFSDAFSKSSASYEDISQNGEAALFLTVDGPQGLFVNQRPGQSSSCGILFGVPDDSYVKPAVSSVLDAWGCPASTVATPVETTLLYKCPDVDVKLDIFESQSEIALGFRFEKP